MNNEVKKPVIFLGGNGSKMSSFYSQNTYVQNILLKALSQGVTDPQELKKIAGLNRIADVYRSLDKLAIRKEYHKVLIDNGLDLNFITKGLKDLAENSTDKIKLGAFNTLLKSIGLDKYEKQEESGKSWEEEIIKVAEVKKDVIEGEVVEDEVEDYEVVVPEIPMEELKRQIEEKKLGRELYED